MKKISVVIPTYNRASVIGRSIDSALNQTIKPYEIIVIDDGSTDATKKVLEKYSDKIRYIYRENSGKPGIARNTGLENVRGDWIAFLDSDDVWLPDKLERQLPLIEKANVPLGLVFGDYEIVRNDKSSSRSKVFNKNDLERIVEFNLAEGKIFKKELFHYFLIWKNPVHTSSVLLNKELLQFVHGFDPSLTIAEDRDLWIRCAEQMQVGYVPEVTCRYTHEGGNITQDNILYAKSVSFIIQRYFDKTKHDLPEWLNVEIKSNLRKSYRSLSFLHAKTGKRGAAIKDIIKSLSYPDSSIMRYLCQISAVLIFPSIYNRIKKGMEMRKAASYE